MINDTLTTILGLIGLIVAYSIASIPASIISAVLAEALGAF